MSAESDRPARSGVISQSDKSGRAASALFWQHAPQAASASCSVCHRRRSRVHLARMHFGQREFQVIDQRGKQPRCCRLAADQYIVAPRLRKKGHDLTRDFTQSSFYPVSNHRIAQFFGGCEPETKPLGRDFSRSWLHLKHEPGRGTAEVDDGQCHRL